LKQGMDAFEGADDEPGGYIIDVCPGSEINYCYTDIILIKSTSSSRCLRTSRKPLISRLLKYSNISESSPPIISRYSYVNLKGAASKPMLPGLFCKKKPKSIWIT
jgi:hypothetical protein